MVTRKVTLEWATCESVVTLVDGRLGNVFFDSVGSTRLPTQQVVITLTKIQGVSFIYCRVWKRLRTVRRRRDEVMKVFEVWWVLSINPWRWSVLSTRQPNEGSAQRTRPRTQTTEVRGTCGLDFHVSHPLNPNFVFVLWFWAHKVDGTFTFGVRLKSLQFLISES